MMRIMIKTESAWLPNRITAGIKMNLRLHFSIKVYIFIVAANARAFYWSLTML